MNTKLSIALLALAGFSLPAMAGKPADTAPACSFSDLTGVTVLGCKGYFSGNLIKGPGADSTVAAILSDLGMVGATGSYIAKIENLNGTHDIDFKSALNGVTFVGLHTGAGQSYNGTVFYKIDAGNTNLHSFNLLLNASSNAAIYSTMPSAVPEPETYALMLAGLAAVGFVAKRRKAA
ncbi:PEP-CTERM sorting domain-containing protein [Paucibacter sp. hw8]|uniref:PEP-CTERM sorting domain-containing protein n=1 Tax=Roseateles albus TaxID=2987525 RepID=A0ABT5KEK7_9BURK|nr:PEP-CTERM sorting domain-containing protein [Roseateles albus]MDC8772343.1 PEP-CTERM sorting domain-containing protein [Roseateles albus]